MFKGTEKVYNFEYKRIPRYVQYPRAHYQKVFATPSENYFYFFNLAKFPYSNFSEYLLTNYEDGQKSQTFF